MREGGVHKQEFGAGPVYAPVASPAPPSPATHNQSATSSEIVPQLQNIVRWDRLGSLVEFTVSCDSPRFLFLIILMAFMYLS